MVRVHTLAWRLLGEWAAHVFLLAGGLLLIATGINGVDLLTPIKTQEGALLFIEGLTGFGGVVLSFLGLLGLYPWLVDAEPRLVRGGISLAVGPGAFFATLLVVCSMLAPLVGLPSLKTLVPPLRLITEVTLLLYAAGTALFGIASLRSATLSRTVGKGLFLVAVSWVGFSGALVFYQYDVPIWVTFVQSATLSVALITVGHWLPSETVSTTSEGLFTDPFV